MEDERFSQDDVSKTIREVIEHTLGGMAYSPYLHDSWTQKLTDKVLSALVKEQKPYKYIVNAIIMQKNGGGLHIASSCLWSYITDGTCTVRWENRTMYCIVSVFGLIV